MILKCKMCGGDIELSADKTCGMCSYCGSTMTFPKVDDEQRANMFNRGNHFRRIGEFDKALAVYERIVQEDEGDAEAHWCCALCRFGIEYVEDPNTLEYLPTCHRASFDSFLEDPDYLAALAHSDGVTKRQYQKDAAKIAEVQRGILATSQNEEPFDVFICYKESENDGSRTRDSLYAQDIYYQLTEQGRRVFFSRITLEDKAGTEYEPYIFAALNSAKVMILVTTSAEHAGAVWVKNEWSRFLSLMRKDRSKLLLPCYRDMDPYDLPEALSVLQSYDMSKIGFIQDLIRGVNKVLDGAKPKDKPQETVVKETVIEKHESGSANIASLLDRAFLALEDGEWERADGFCEQVLNLDSRNAQAYLGKLMAERHVRKREALRDCAQPFDDSNNYRKALRFGDDKLKQELTGAVAFIQDRNETARKEGVYQKALTAMAAKTEQGYREAAELFGTIPEYKDATAQSEVCVQKGKDSIYGQAWILMKKDTKDDLSRAAQLFQSIPGWKDADVQNYACKIKIERIKAKEEAQRVEAEHKAEEERQATEARKRKNKRLAVILAAVTAVIITIILLATKVIIPNREYNEAIALYESGQYKQAKAILEALDGYKDSDGYIHACWDHVAVRNAVAAGYFHTVGLKADGTVVAVGYNKNGQCDVSDWKDIVAVAAGGFHTVGLKADGTVVAVGYNEYHQCRVSDWTDIVAVATGSVHTVGLKADGTVVAVGWNEYGQCRVSGWTDIVAIAAGSGHTVGLKADGTVVAVGDNDDRRCNVSDWRNIVAVAAGGAYTVGLKADGTVVATKYTGDKEYNFGQCDVDRWKDIVAVAAGGFHTVGLKADGTVVATKYTGDKEYNFGQCDVSDWKNIRLPER